MMYHVASFFEMETLCIVLPCYNEAEGLQNTIVRLNAKLEHLGHTGKVTAESSVLFTDDGSTDNTWAIIKSAHHENPRITGIRLATNRGKENALFAGLMEARKHADIIISMDADLQHDIDAIEDFLEERAKGYDFVYGVKSDRGNEPITRKAGAKMFYWLMQKLGTPVRNDYSDYCLMSRQVVDALSEYGEGHMMLRALLFQLGFEQKAVTFAVKERKAGKSKMTFLKLIKLSVDALTSYSATPLRLLALIGVLIFCISLCMILWTIHDYCVLGTPNGWATITCSIWFIGGVIIISLAVLGEYIGKMYIEAKKRPRFFIREKLI